MRIEDPKVYPLDALLKCIPDEGLQLNKETLAQIARLFSLGGVICEEFDELVTALNYLAEWTGLVNLDHKLTTLILRKNYNGD